MRQQQIIPVYMMTGMLESGKTKMIQEMLTDQGFSSGQRTLILCCEEGVEEYDTDLLNDNNTVLVTLDAPEMLTSLKLKELNKRHNPERVIVEYNTFWKLERLAEIKLPPRWEFVQVITLADGTTFDNYMTNVRQQLTDPMKEADLVLVNRCKPEHEISKWRRLIRSINPNCNILFEMLDGTTVDGVSDEDLPYDMKADVIEIGDDQMGLFYLDALDHADRYDGKVVRLLGQPFLDKEAPLPAGYYYFGREAMTCCANDMRKIGWVCQGTLKPDGKSFVRLTARCQVMRRGEESIIMMVEQSSTPAAAPKDEYVTFTNI